MKYLTKGILPDAFTNPVSRSLILILLFALVVAVSLVTAVFFFAIGY